MPSETNSAEQLNPSSQQAPESDFDLNAGEVEDFEKSLEAKAKKEIEELWFPAQETMTGKAKEVFKSLASESRKFLGGLYDKIKSTDVVQNVVDRFKVWNNDRLGQREEKKRLNLEQQAADFRMRNKNTDEVMKKGREAGGTFDAESLAKIKAEKAEMEKKAAACDEKVKEGKGALKEYQKEAKMARKGLDGRLEEKMKVNNGSIKEYTKYSKDLGKDLDRNNGKIEELNIRAEKLQALLDAGVEKSVREGFEKALKDLSNKRKQLEVSNSLLQEEKGKIDVQIADLVAKNDDLQAKRDAIFPPKEKAQESNFELKVGEAEDQKEAGEEKKLPIEFEYDQGDHVIMDESGVKETFFDETTKKEITKEYTYDNLTNDDVDEIADKVPMGALENSSVPKEFIERVTKAKEAKAALAAEQPEVESAKKFVGKNLIEDWNKNMASKLGKEYKITHKKLAQVKEYYAQKDYGSREGARKFLMSLLTEKAKDQIDTFLRERK